jgi:hypothetical protein
MQIEIFTIADKASNIEGRLTIEKTFDRILTDVVPHTHPHCSVVVRIRLANNNAGLHKIEIRSVAPGGFVLGKLSIHQLFRASVDSDYVASNIIIPISNLYFDAYGKYSLELYYDDDFASGLSLYVMPRAVSVISACSIA